MRGGRLADGHDLGMGGGIVAGDRAVGAAAQHLAGGRIDHHGAHRRLAGVGGGLRQTERDAH